METRMLTRKRQLYLLAYQLVICDYPLARDPDHGDMQIFNTELPYPSLYKFAVCPLPYDMMMKLLLMKDYGVCRRSVKEWIATKLYSCQAFLPRGIYILQRAKPRYGSASVGAT
ncbi:hypothetical protein ZeamMp109 (mitochondrion) [Zea mays subsp. mays]|uniref:Uncharacterized protein n=1 Tax=Zea mays TaxID=4577 RepID=Q6R9D9_MAIZE|nr:hypothetical protein ZeamMp109 [Zea mays subsp. mays]AAR91145.1 hypothetical protein [Zea mays]|eukprot:YP_588369.1 hypothetical protein ZeamMp109 (mitochondrion) [Zea mays subsp. mays]